MDTNRFTTLAKSPELAGSEDLSALSKLLEKYPYFQAARLLFAKASGATAQTVKAAAAYTTERSILQRIMDRDFNSNINLPTLGNDFLRSDNFNAFPHLVDEDRVTVEQPVSEVLDTEEKLTDQGGEAWGNDDLPSPDELIARLHRFKANKEHASLDDITASAEDMEDLASFLRADESPCKQRTEAPLPEVPDNALPFVDFSEELPNTEGRMDYLLPDSGLFAPFQQAVEGRELVFSKKEATDSRDYQDFIIERFIQSNPCLSRPKTMQESEESKEMDLSAPYAKRYQTVATETLARILTHQGKIAQAIEIYRALQLKYPDKSVFFAGEIEVLKEKFHQSDKS